MNLALGQPTTIDMPGINAMSLAPRGKLRILYAEDQASARVVTTALLTRLGYEVDAVEDGELALDKAKSQSYDVILLDIEMPIMDGAQAAERIRCESDFCRDVPIVALSAFLADSTETCGWRKAFDHALPKPATARELETAVAFVLGEKTRVEPIAKLSVSFRDELPTSMWHRLAEKAADEMRSLALTIAACSDAEDWDVLAKTTRALKCLAVNFQAEGVNRMVDGLKPGSGTDGVLLNHRIAQWQEQALAA
jgi:CheY-like chemotaxis protein